MAFTNTEGRQELLYALAGAVDHLALALAALGDAYEQLDDATADRLEADLFGPVQAAYGRAKRTHVQFADRHGQPAAIFAPRTAGVPSTGAKGFVEAAVGATRAADSALAALYALDRMQSMGHNVIAVTGAITSSPLAVREFQRHSGVPVAHSTGNGEELGEAACRQLQLAI